MRISDWSSDVCSSDLRRSCRTGDGKSRAGRQLMVNTAEELRASLDVIAAMEPGFAAAIGRVGYPLPRMREPGYETLLRTIVGQQRSEEHTSELQSLMRISYAVFCLKQKIE